MHKIVRLLFICLSSSMLVTGCWSKRELNELGIASALGIDKMDDGYLVTVQIINPGEIAGKSNSGRTEVVRFMHKGDTISDAFRKLMTDAPRTVYLAHLREVVFGEELAKSGIAKALDALAREEELRADFYVTIARNSTAAEILNIQTAIEKIPANKLFNVLENSERNWAKVKTVKLDELITSIISNGKEAVLTGINIYGNPEYGSNVINAQNVSPKTGLRINGVGVFKKDKLLGWLDEDESKGFNYIVNNIKGTTVMIPCEDGIISIETRRSKSSVKGKMVKGKPEIDIFVNSEGNIGEVECNTDVTKLEKIKEFEQKYQKNIKNKIEKAVHRLQKEYKSDIFGFGEAIHRGNPKAWKNLEKNWNEEFPHINVKVHVKANIRRLGPITDSIQNKIEEK